MSIPANLEQLDIEALHGVFMGLVQEGSNCMPNARKDAAITDQADILNKLPENPRVMRKAIGKLSAKIDAAKRKSHSGEETLALVAAENREAKRQKEGVWSSGYHSPFELQEYETEEQRDERLRTTELVAMKREDRRSLSWRRSQDVAASPSEFWSVSSENPEWKKFYEEAEQNEAAAKKENRRQEKVLAIWAAQDAAEEAGATRAEAERIF